MCHFDDLNHSTLVFTTATSLGGLTFFSQMYDRINPPHEWFEIYIQRCDITRYIHTEEASAIVTTNAITYEGYTTLLRSHQTI